MLKIKVCGEGYVSFDGGMGDDATFWPMDEDDVARLKEILDDEGVEYRWDVEDAGEEE